MSMLFAFQSHLRLCCQTLCLLYFNALHLFLTSEFCTPLCALHLCCAPLCLPYSHAVCIPLSDIHPHCTPLCLLVTSLATLLLCIFQTVLHPCYGLLGLFYVHFLHPSYFHMLHPYVCFFSSLLCTPLLILCPYCAPICPPYCTQLSFRPHCAALCPFTPTFYIFQSPICLHDVYLSVCLMLMVYNIMPPQHNSSELNKSVEYLPVIT